MSPRLPLAVGLALALGGTGCLFSPKGRCDSAADCAADEVCYVGLCMPADRFKPGVDPTSFTSVKWSRLAGVTDATFRVDSVGADLDGNVVVAGAVDAGFSFGITVVPAGAFVLRCLWDHGDASWATSFPTFEHGRFKAAVVPEDGGVFFAATIFDATTIGTLSYSPPLKGSLVFGRLDAGGVPLWARAVDDTSTDSMLVPTAVAVTDAGDLLIAGTGSADFGCGGGDTAGETFAASLLGADGSCRWSRGFGTQNLSDAEPSGANVVVAGVCTPSGVSFDPDGTTTCASGLFLADLAGDSGATLTLRTTSGTGTVAAAYDLAVAPDGRKTVIGDASGIVDFGGGPIDFGANVASFAATFDAGGASTVVRPIEEPYADQPDALAFSRCAYDRSGRLWLAGVYVGQPVLGGIRFSACRDPGTPDCLMAAFLARLEANGAVSSFLPLRASPDTNGAAYVDDLVLFATTGTVAHALRFSGVGSVDGTSWTSIAGDLGALRIVP